MNKLLLTGRPRSGKTTALQNSLAGFEALGGFAVQRLTRNQETWAFRLLDLAEEPYISHLETNQEYDDIAIHMLSTGKWQGIPEVFNRKGCRALDRCLARRQLVIMDELGIFERDALAFQASVFRILDSSLPVLGVLKDKANPFLDGVRSHPGLTILQFPGQETEQALDSFLAQLRY